MSRFRSSTATKFPNRLVIPDSRTATPLPASSSARDGRSVVCLSSTLILLCPWSRLGTFPVRYLRPPKPYADGNPRRRRRAWRVHPAPPPAPPPRRPPRSRAARPSRTRIGTRAAGGEHGEYTPRRPMPRFHGAVHVPVPPRCRLGPRPVDAAHRLLQRWPVVQKEPRRGHARVAAARVGLGAPVALRVAARIEGHLPEVPGEAVEDRLFAFRGMTPSPPAGLRAQDGAG